MEHFFLQRIYRIIRKRKFSPIKRINKMNYIFIHINKTGGTSIGRALKLPYKSHLTAIEVIERIGEKKWNDTFKFAFVRNPWDKVISLYNYRLKTNQNNMKENPIDFNNWVKVTFGDNINSCYHDNLKMFAPQIEWLKDKKGQINIDFIGKFENINDDFKVIAKILGINEKLPHLNKTKKTNRKDFYNEETKLIIENWFKEDILTFKYSFNE